jgi:hypothetical protein
LAAAAEMEEKALKNQNPRPAAGLQAPWHTAALKGFTQNQSYINYSMMIAPDTDLSTDLIIHVAILYHRLKKNQGRRGGGASETMQRVQPQLPICFPYVELRC